MLTLKEMQMDFSSAGKISQSMVVPYIYQILRTYAPAVTLPIAIVVGAIGYTLENMVREDKTPTFESIEEKRRKRQEELGKVLISPDPIPDPSKIVPKTILDKNLPPSLQPGINK